MFKFFIASIILATASSAIDCSDEFNVDSESTFLKDGLAVYSSNFQARIYNLSTSTCIVSFEGSRIDYPIVERIFTFNTIQNAQENKWNKLPGKVAIDYLKQDGNFDDFGTVKVCDTKSKTYRMSTIGIVNCPLVLKLHKEHDSGQSMVSVVILTMLQYTLVMCVLLVTYTCVAYCFSEKMRRYVTETETETELAASRSEVESALREADASSAAMEQNKRDLPQ